MTDAELLDAEMPRATHTDSCEAEPGHPWDCATATELCRLRAFAEAVRDEFMCGAESTPEGDIPPDHVDDCWRCYAVQALERAK
jgi:hypothetical protein